MALLALNVALVSNGLPPLTLSNVPTEGLTCAPRWGRSRDFSILGGSARTY
jgi:hypothetical protein